MSLFEMSAVELARALRDREVSVHELLSALEERVLTENSKINALIEVDFLAARAQLQSYPSKQLPGPLYGLPVVVKDQYDVSGFHTTWGHPKFKENKAFRDDLFVEKIKASGGIIYSKSNVPEMGAGAHTTNSVFGTTVNPHDLEKSAGGSSGGSAAAVAARIAWLATGSDSGGSLRIPAALCGVVGFRPSVGVVPYGPRTYSYDGISVCGPIARSVADAALLLDAMAGWDYRDPISRPWTPGSAIAAAATSKRAIRIAVSQDLGLFKSDAEVVRVFEAAVRRLEAAGFDVDYDCPSFKDVVEVGNTLRRARTTSLRPMQSELATHLQDEINMGMEIGSDAIARAEVRRSEIIRDVTAFFDGFDALICPTTITTAFDANMLFPTEVAGIRYQRYADWFHITNALTLAGVPVVSIPCGVTEGGLPVGMQIASRIGSDLSLLSVASTLENVLGSVPAPRTTTTSKQRGDC
ncbi:amidase [Bradyrhizobium sp. USDA 336]|uniref:amidase n=1 Tax=Bradyrhizobium sp. USDA 336 TaxID=3156311 RepID=UPI00383812A3